MQGKTVRRIKQDALVKDPEFSGGLPVDGPETLSVFTESDTTRVFNDLSNRFTPSVFSMHRKVIASACL